MQAGNREGLRFGLQEATDHDSRSYPAPDPEGKIEPRLQQVVLVNSA